jgi:hypothetical protein
MTPVVPNGTSVPSTFQQGASSNYYRAPAMPANSVPANVAPSAPFDYNPPPKPRPALTTEAPQRTWTFRRVSAVSEQPTASAESSSTGGWRAAKR